MGYIGSKPSDNIKQQKTIIENNQENTPIADEQDEEQQRSGATVASVLLAAGRWDDARAVARASPFERTAKGARCF